MDTVIRFSAVGIAAALAAMLLKKAEPAFAPAVTTAAAAAISAAIVGILAVIYEFVSGYSAELNLPAGSFEIMLRTAATVTAAKLSSELCRGAGEPALASLVDLLGAAAAVLTTLPLWSAVLGILESFIR